MMQLLIYKLIPALLILFVCNVNAQESYFDGKLLVCGSTNEKTLDLLTNGLVMLRMSGGSPKSAAVAEQMFLNAIDNDTLCCDAWFLAGFSMGLQNKVSESMEYLYFADSLSYNKSRLFKQHYAMAALKMGITDIAKDKFYEMVRFFPNKTEGYVGIAMVSIETDDYERGLKAIDRAIEKYKTRREEIDDKLYVMKAILLAMLERYEIADSFFSDLAYDFKKDDFFNMYYAYNLFKLAEKNSDKRMYKKARKHYYMIEDKNSIPKKLYKTLDRIDEIEEGED